MSSLNKIIIGVVVVSVLSIGLLWLFGTSSRDDAGTAGAKKPPLSAEERASLNLSEDSKIFKRAIQMRSSDECSSIKDEEVRQSCLQEIADALEMDYFAEAESQMDPELCLKLSIEEDQKSCVDAIQKLLDDRDVEPSIQKGKEAYQGGDIALCDEMETDELAEVCRKSFVDAEQDAIFDEAVRTLDKTKCYELEDRSFVAGCAVVIHEKLKK